MAAYQQVSGSGPSTTAFGLEALEAAHLAIIEVAGLLRGSPPRGPAETEYVDTRTLALLDLATVLPRMTTDGAAASAGDVGGEQAREAGVAAVRELEALTGGGSVARLGVLRSLLTRPEP